MDGPLTCEHLDGLVPTAYRCGPVFGIRLEVAGISLYHQGSADLDDDELPHHPVDVFLAGVAGRDVTPRYWERVLPRLDPRVIVPTHYDDFFAPLGGPERFVRKVDLASLDEEIAAAAGDASAGCAQAHRRRLARERSSTLTSLWEEPQNHAWPSDTTPFLIAASSTCPASPSKRSRVFHLRPRPCPSSGRPAP